MKFLALFFLMSTSVMAGPSFDDCTYYKELEARMSCGEKGYALSFGLRLCETYLRAQNTSRPQVRKWYPKVRYCLQDYLYKNAHRANSCRELETMAYHSHVGCYLETGFCDLNVLDVASILKTTGRDVLRARVLEIGSKVLVKCL